MRVVLVRHGETEGQSSIRYYGATNVPLSTLGRAQMQRGALALRGERFDAIYASALARARDGALIIAGRDPTPLSGFNEIDFGDWEGLTDAEIRARDPERHAAWHARSADFHYPGGESTQAFAARVVATLRAVLQRETGSALLLVLHKGVIRTILTELLRLDLAARDRLGLELGSIHIVQGAGDTWCAAQLDHVHHLAGVAERETR